MRLSDVQVHALCEIANHGRVNATQAMIVVGRSWRRTIGKLEDRGLVRYMPYSFGGGAYGITRDGRKTVKQLVETGRAVYEADMKTARGCVADRG